jgi:4-amino-4-deoxy-L-arabinose transferase-like glycosyltransferase
MWFELVAFFSDLAPWSILIVVAMWFDWRRRDSLSSSTRVLYLWLAGTLLLFSISSFKLDYYLLPAMPAGALIIAPVIARSHGLPRLVRVSVKTFFILCAAAIVIVALLSLKAAGALSVSTPFRFLPIVFALIGLGVIIIFVARRKPWQTMFVLTATMWFVFVSMQLVWSTAFAAYLPATRIAASVPEGSDVYTSWAASDWANGIAFSIPPPHRVERLVGDDGNQKLIATLSSAPKSVAVIRESEYANLVARDPNLKILARAETFGHGGLSLNMLRDPRRERLFLIGR